MISLLSALVLLCAQTPAPTAPPPAKLDQATRLAVDKALAWLASKPRPFSQSPALSLNQPSVPPISQSTKQPSN